VTKPVLYRYFADKAALVRALGEHASALLQERLVPALTADGPALARIRDGGRGLLAIIDENPELYWLLARPGGAGGRPEPGVAARQKELIAHRADRGLPRLPEQLSGWTAGPPNPGRSASPAWCRARGLVAGPALDQPRARRRLRHPADLVGADRGVCTTPGSPPIRAPGSRPPTRCRRSGPATWPPRRGDRGDRPGQHASRRRPPPQCTGPGAPGPSAPAPAAEPAATASTSPRASRFMC